MLHTRTKCKKKKPLEYDILIEREREESSFPLDNEGCDRKKENSKNYTSLTVAIILVMSLV